MSQIEDVEAIDSYMRNAVPKTTEAGTVKNQYLAFFSKGSWWDKNMDSDWYDTARSYRNSFNLKNATTPAQVSQVQEVLARGITTEQMQGKPRPPINVKTGAVGSQVKTNTMPTSKPLKQNLKLGVKNDDVKTWQAFLGLTPPTGVFDKLTDTKTREYQKLQGLVADGIVGPKTWGKAFEQVKAPDFAPVAAPTVAASIAQTFKPTATPAPVAAAFKSPVKPTTIPATAFAPSNKKVEFKQPVKAASTPIVPPTANVLKAGMLPDMSKVPTWAKVVGGLGLAAAVVLGPKMAMHLK